MTLVMAVMSGLGTRDPGPDAHDAHDAHGARP